MTFTVGGIEREFSLELGDGRLNLMMADSIGTTWFVVGITEVGKLVRYRSIPTGIGLKLTELGRVKVDKGAS